MNYTAKMFSNDSGVSLKLAKRILDVLDEKELSAEDLNVVIWKLRDFVMKQNMPTLMEKSKAEDIAAIVDQIIMERAMWRDRCGAEVCGAQNAEELSRAFSNSLVPEVAWFFEEIAAKAPEGGYKAGDLITIQIFRVGKWEHPGYGTVEITKKTIKDVVKNFDERARGIDLCVDENHEPDHKALGWYKEVYAEDGGKACFAKIELTKKGADLLNEGAYKYFSPEICFHKVDEESGETLTNLLIGGALTNRPFFKGMQPLMATEGAAAEGQTSVASASSGAYFFSPQASMHKLLMHLDKLAEKDTISASEKAELEMLFSDLPESDRTAEMKKAVAEVVAKFDEGDGSSTAPAADAAPEAEKPKEGEDGAAPAAEVPAADATQVDVDAELPAGEVKATEEGFIVDAVFMENAKKMQRQLSEMTSKATLQACETTAKNLQFSEAKPTNVVLPKHVPRIAKFSAGLSDANRKEFFEILAGLKSVPAGTKGHAHNAQKLTGVFSEAKDIPADDEKIKYFMEKMDMNEADARQSAFHFYSEKNKASK